jgi:hypothetical protein
MAEIRFRSPLVNEENQRFAWSGSKEEQVGRVLEGKKPMAVALFKDSEEAGKFIKKVKREGRSIGTEVVASLMTGMGYDKTYTQVVIANKGRLEQLFDLDTLLGDYVEALGPKLERELARQFENFKSTTLLSFSAGWDVEHVPPWVTGLILGYPVEETMGNFYYGV